MNKITPPTTRAPAETTVIGPSHRAAVAAFVAGLTTVAHVPGLRRADDTDVDRADAVLIMLRRFADEPTEAAALRQLAAVDALLDVPGEDHRAHPCPVCGLPALGRVWQYLAVCDACRAKALCRDGRTVVGATTGPGGGFAARHRDDRSECDHVTGTGAVWIDGRECRMGEAILGGVFVGALCV
jgi:ribosomal protein L37AE/L43A